MAPPAPPQNPRPPQVGDRYRVLLDIGRALAEERGTAAIHAAVHRETARVLPADGFFIFLWDEGTDVARVVYWADGTEEEHGAETFPGSRSEVIRRGRALRVDDGLADRSLVTLGGDGRAATRSAVAAPLRTADGIMGAISVQSYRPGVYDEDDVELLQGIADVASTAIRHALQLEELERRRREAEEILAVARDLSASLEEEEVLRRIVEASRKLLGVDHAHVWTLQGDRLLVRSVSGPARIPEDVPIPGQGRLGDLLLRRREAVILEDVSRSELLPEALRHMEDCRSLMLVPLVAGARAIGALSVGSAAARGFSPEEARLLHRLAGHAALALENAHLHARLHAASLTDPLTGLPNRRHLELHLEQEFAAARRGRPLSVVLFDLDDFKQYNDALGHLAGDEALRTVGEVLDSETRAMNLVARYGGDEFVAVLSDTDVEGARRHARRVARRLARSPVAGPLALRISWGVAEFGEGLDSGKALLEAADRALYRAKTGVADPSPLPSP
ncbi:MAG: diguanylate cyclase [Gemmatimonadales bacterium]|nr:MAG: diguanylate cyclase [Gemmatimonadales bacterium]